MEQNRRSVSIKANASIIAGARRSSSRARTLLRNKRRKRSKLLRKA